MYLSIKIKSCSEIRLTDEVNLQMPKCLLQLEKPADCYQNQLFTIITTYYRYNGKYFLESCLKWKTFQEEGEIPNFCSYDCVNARDTLLFVVCLLFLTQISLHYLVEDILKCLLINKNKIYVKL